MAFSTTGGLVFLVTATFMATALSQQVTDITQISGYSSLGCARFAVDVVIRTPVVQPCLTQAGVPSCFCNSDNSLYFDSQIASLVGRSCLGGTTGFAVQAAQTVFSSYCRLGYTEATTTPPPAPITTSSNPPTVITSTTANTTTSDTTPPLNTSSPTLSTGAIAGIAVAVTVFVLTIALIALWRYRNRNQVVNPPSHGLVPYENTDMGTVREWRQNTQISLQDPHL